MGKSPTELLRVLYSNYGQADYIGEAVSQLEHALQCAQNAEEDGAPMWCVVAALLHDVGQIVGLERKMKALESNVGIVRHENVGAEFLKDLGFDDVICSIVRNHVNAKRYLAAKNQEPYINRLSEASKLSLIQQGGPMSEFEMREFEKNENFHWYLKMREWDDAAKKANFTCKDIEYYFEMVEAVCAATLRV